MKSTISTSEPVEFSYSEEHHLDADIYRADEPEAPTVLYLHGGGFQRGDKRDDVTRLRMLAALGVNVVSVNYRLAPEWRYPSPVEDVLLAAAVVRERGPSFGLSTDSLGIIGASAGGFLAAAAALTKDSGRRAFDAASIWFAGTDLVESTRRSPLEARISPVTYELALLGDEADADAFRASSPARWPADAAPPFLIVHGDSDKVVSPGQSAALHDTLARQGRESTLIRLAGAGHEDPAFDSEPVLAMVAGWMKARLRIAPETSR